MTNLLLAEYEAILSEVAARWGATETGQQEAHWTSPLRNLSVGLHLEAVFEPSGEMHLRPRASIGQSTTLPTNAHAALIILRDNELTLQKALSAWIEVEKFRVYTGACPCDYCSGRGEVCSSPCKTCGGTGWREKSNG